jgi:hypothetical protein
MQNDYGINEEDARELQVFVTERHGEWWRYEIALCLQIHIESKSVFSM